MAGMSTKWMGSSMLLSCQPVICFWSENRTHAILQETFLSFSFFLSWGFFLPFFLYCLLYVCIFLFFFLSCPILFACLLAFLLSFFYISPITFVSEQLNPLVFYTERCQVLHWSIHMNKSINQSDIQKYTYPSSQPSNPFTTVSIHPSIHPPHQPFIWNKPRSTDRPTCTVCGRQYRWTCPACWDSRAFGSWGMRAGRRRFLRCASWRRCCHGPRCWACETGRWSAIPALEF